MTSLLPPSPVRDDASAPRLSARHTQRWRTAAALVALAAFALSAHLFNPHTRADNRDTAAVPAALAAALVGALALSIAAPVSALPAPAAPPAAAPPAAAPARTARRPLGSRRVWLCAAGLFCLAFVAEVNSGIVLRDAVRALSVHTQFVLFVAGAALVTLAFALPPAGHTHTARTPAARRRPSAALVVLLITLAAFAVRVVNLDNGVRVLIHELSFTDPVLTLQTAPPASILLFTYSHKTTPFPWLFSYTQYIAAFFFGNTLFSIRLPAALFGALTVPALWLLAERLFNRRVAFAAALILATFPPHVHFSRLGIIEIVDPLLGTLAFACIAAALRVLRPPTLSSTPLLTSADAVPEGQRGEILRTPTPIAWFAAAGLLLGLTHYFHEGGRLAFTPLALLWLAGVAFTQRDAARPLLAGAARMLLVSLIVAAPYYLTLAGRGLELFPRIADSAMLEATWQQTLAFRLQDDSLALRLAHLLRPFLLYVHTPDQPIIFLYYGGDTPLVLSPLVPLLLLAVAYAIPRWRSPGWLLLLLWLVLVTLGLGWMKENMTSTRFRVMFPALALLLALAVACILPRLLTLLSPSSPAPTRDAPALSWRPRRLPALALTLSRLSRLAVPLALLIIAAAQTVYYFDVHLPRYNVQIRETIYPCGDQDDAILRAAALPFGTHIHLIGTDAGCDLNQATSLLRYLQRDPLFTSVDSPLAASVTPAYLDGLASGVGHAFFVRTTDTATQTQLVQTLTSRGLVFLGYSPYAVPLDDQFMLYYLLAQPEPST